MYQSYPGQNPFSPYQGNAMGQQFSRPYQPYSPPVPPRPNPAPVEVYQVSNVEEAKAQIANPVAPTMFCNFGQGEVYVKHIDNNGQGQFLVFRMVNEQPKEEVNPWVPIMQRLDSIEQLLGSKANVSEPISESASATSSSPKLAASTGIGTKSTGNAVGKN